MHLQKKGYSSSVVDELHEYAAVELLKAWRLAIRPG